MYKGYNRNKPALGKIKVKDFAKDFTLVYNHEFKKMKNVLITGANKSISFESARQLLQKGYYVYLG